MTDKDRHTLQNMMGHTGFFVDAAQDRGVIFGVKMSQGITGGGVPGVAFALVNYKASEVRDAFPQKGVFSITQVEVSLAMKMRELLPTLLGTLATVQKQNFKTLITFTAINLKDSGPKK